MSVVLENEDKSTEVVTDNASLLEVKDGGVEISSLFDPPRTLTGVKVARIDFMNSKVFLTNG
jgi:predicted RNA-binding protein